MSKVDEIREHINDGRTIRRIEVKELLAEYDRLTAELAESQRRARDARNELCLKCGKYPEAHKGACDGCRWKEE